MKITLQFLHFNAQGPLTSYALNKVEKLSRFNRELKTANVCLRVDKAGDRRNKTCEIRLEMPGKEFFAKRHAETFQKAINSVVEALEEQVRNLHAPVRVALPA